MTRKKKAMTKSTDPRLFIMILALLLVLVIYLAFNAMDNGKLSVPKAGAVFGVAGGLTGLVALIYIIVDSTQKDILAELQAIRKHLVKCNAASRSEFECDIT